MIKTLLIDMDCILVDMLPAWLKTYNERSGENVRVSHIVEYDVGSFVKDPGLLYEILEDPEFFLKMKPMNYAVPCFRKLLKDGYDVVVLTQPPRRADYAVKDKRAWIKKYFENYDLSNMMFGHRKSLVRGDLLFDDRPTHLQEWKAENPQGITATLTHPYNRHCTVDWRFDLRSGWKDFYEMVKKNS